MKMYFKKRRLEMVNICLGPNVLKGRKIVASNMSF